MADLALTGDLRSDKKKILLLQLTVCGYILHLPAVAYILCSDACSGQCFLGPSLLPFCFDVQMKFISVAGVDVVMVKVEFPPPPPPRSLTPFFSYSQFCIPPNICFMLGIVLGDTSKSGVRSCFREIVLVD